MRRTQKNNFNNCIPARQSKRPIAIICCTKTTGKIATKSTANAIATATLSSSSRHQYGRRGCLSSFSSPASPPPCPIASGSLTWQECDFSLSSSSLGESMMNLACEQEQHLPYIAGKHHHQHLSRKRTLLFVASIRMYS
jgi:hypothetical protein